MKTNCYQITEERIRNYYCNYFRDDLYRYFIVEQNDGVEYIRCSRIAHGVRLGYPTWRTPVLPAAAAAAAAVNSAAAPAAASTGSSDAVRIENGDKVDDFVFGFILLCIARLEESTRGFLREKYQDFKKTWGYPTIISSINYRHDEVFDTVLADAYVHPHSREEYRLFLEIIDRGADFVTAELMGKVENWADSNLDNDAERSCLMTTIESCLRKDFFEMKHFFTRNI